MNELKKLHIKTYFVLKVTVKATSSYKSSEIPFVFFVLFCFVLLLFVCFLFPLVNFTSF